MFNVDAFKKAKTVYLEYLYSSIMFSPYHVAQIQSNKYTMIISDIILQLINRNISLQIKIALCSAAVMHYLLDVFFRQRHPGSDLKENVFLFSSEFKYWTLSPPNLALRRQIWIAFPQFASGLSRCYQRVCECSVTSVWRRLCSKFN